jgi:GTP-binding protein
VFLLIDCRRGVGSADAEIMKLLDGSAVSWAVVMTKADKLKPGALEAVCAATLKLINTHVAAYPELFITSSETRDGIAELRAHLAGLALPKS